MGLKPRFDTKKPIPENITRAFRQKVENDLVQILKYVGEDFVRNARLMTKAEGGFGDVTGNLRSSIGYFILKDGEILIENLTRTSGTRNELTEAGKTAARSALTNVRKSSGYQLVGVAGMDYAGEVESRGLNVISVQKEMALVSLNKLLRKYTSQLNAMGVSFYRSGELVSTVLR